MQCTTAKPPGNSPEGYLRVYGANHSRAGMPHIPRGRRKPFRAKPKTGRETMENTTKAALAAVGTAATYLWGGWDAVLMALVVLACMDYVTGWAAAWVGKRLSSDAGRKGIAKKAGMFVIVAVCNIVDQLGGLGDPILRTVSIWWYIGNEALSIVENLGEVGVPIPGRLREALAILRDREGTPHGR